jgi:hypothetical protein
MEKRQRVRLDNKRVGRNRGEVKCRRCNGGAAWSICGTSVADIGMVSTRMLICMSTVIDVLDGMAKLVQCRALLQEQDQKGQAEQKQAVASHIHIENQAPARGSTYLQQGCMVGDSPRRCNCVAYSTRRSEKQRIPMPIPVCRDDSNSKVPEFIQADNRAPEATKQLSDGRSVSGRKQLERLLRREEIAVAEPAIPQP